MRILAGNFVLDLSTRTHLMGIVNLTPDSFSRDGLLRKRLTPLTCVKHIQKLIAQGADIIDVGAESTRPGAKPVASKEEIQRLIPTLKALIPKINVPVSVDSYKTDVIHAALDCGVTIINYIQGSKVSKKLLRLARDYNAAIILMHMRGSPLNMHLKTSYNDLLSDITSELGASLDFCLDFGLKKDRIIIDPGFGFAKTAQQNLLLLDRLNELSVLGSPILVGTSRKSFLGNVIGDMNKDRLAATAASVSISIIKGAKIVRVHDVAFIKDVICITDSLKKS